MKGYFQYQQNESWDWDEMNAPMLVDFKKDGATTKGLLKPARNGYLYWLKRNPDGGISYINAQAYVPQNVFKSIDPKTGRPEVDMAHKPATGKAAQFCPGLWGGKDWPFEAYNPKTGMVYIPSNQNHCNNLEGKVEERVPGQWWTGVAIPDLHFSVDTKASFYGELQAYDVDSGKRVWSNLYPSSMMWGSMLTTGGGLLFTGGTNDREFRAYDAKTGEQLWHFKTNSGIMAPPSTYEVNGVQYVAVQSGYGVDPAFQQGLMSELVGWQKGCAAGRRRLGLRRLQVSPSLFATGHQQWRPVSRPAGFRCLVKQPQPSGFQRCNMFEQDRCRSASAPLHWPRWRPLRPHRGSSRRRPTNCPPTWSRSPTCPPRSASRRCCTPRCAFATATAFSKVTTIA